MKNPIIKILLVLCVALLPEAISARTYRLVQCHIVECGTGKEYDLQRAQYGAELNYDVEYDIRARIYRGKAPYNYHSHGYNGSKQFEFKEYSGYLTELNNGRIIKIYLNDLGGYINAKLEYNQLKSYLIYEAVY